MTDFGVFHDFDETRTLGVQIDELIRVCALAEDAGFGSLWTGENQPQEPSPLLPSPLLVLASVARQTGLRVGTGITLAPLWDAHRLAADSAVLDQLSDGRFLLGLGVGNPGIWKRFGIPPETVRDVMDDLLECLPRLWRGEPGFRGRKVSVDGPIWPLPVHPEGIPIWVAGRTRRSVRRAADHQAFYVSTPVRLDEIARLAGLYRDELVARGKDPGQARVAANRIMVVVEEEKDVEQVALPYVLNVLRTYAGLGALRTADGVTRTPDDDLFGIFADDVCLVGTPETIVESVRRYAAAGVTDLHFRVRGGRMPLEHTLRSLALFRDEVLPRLGAEGNG